MWWSADYSGLRRRGSGHQYRPSEWTVMGIALFAVPAGILTSSFLEQMEQTFQ